MALITEFTGVSGVGKSTFLDRFSEQGSSLVFSREACVPKWLSRVHPFLGKMIGEMLIWGYFIIKWPVSLALLRLLFKLAFTSDERLIFRINIFRNALLKFAVRNYLRNHYPDQNVLVDEGISHLPFLFQYSSSGLQDAASIYSEFRSYFDTSEVVILEASGIDLKKRLLERGHSRLGAELESRVAEFSARNYETLIEIKAAMDQLEISYQSINLTDEKSLASFLHSTN